ncbi:hypothetical protein VTJ83DRAFT_427 [Remersonia thermophila]|uniref:Uncharacterized protein n=1 Tax=Remersonia thermophila TaxID=72144 RepID=A0ABR4DM63_9PEZI
MTLETQQAQEAWQQQQQQQQQQHPQPENEPKQWRPSIVLGSPLSLEGEDLNAIQMADRKVAQTRLWASHYQGVPYFQEAHQKALREREQLDETAEENLLPQSALDSTHEAAIQERLDLLRSLLRDSVSPDERANLQAAIAGYETGAIPCSDSYTLIWAGRVVDRCPDFDSFTVDRDERLDRYAAAHGPGWLWYEPPLAGGGGTAVANKAFCLESKARWRKTTDNMGHYRILMGFRPRMLRVSRGAEPSSYPPPTSPAANAAPRGPSRRRKGTAPAAPPPPSLQPLLAQQTIPQPNTSPAGRTMPSADGPCVVYSMLLDSGATLPSLYEADLPKLGINRQEYPATSARVVNTADSTLYTRVYELDVSILGGDEDDLAAPAAGAGGGEDAEEEEADPEPMSCTTPVIIFPGAAKAGDGDFPANNRWGNDAPGRLSGLLPFHVCYLASAPGTFRLWMGDQRRDVLGAGRLPGLKRYGEILGGVNATERARRTAAAAAAAGTAAATTGLRQPGTNVASTTGAGAAAVTIPPHLQRPATVPGIMASLEAWAKHALGKPERVIFEHRIPDGSGYLLREEDVGDGLVIMTGPRGTDFDRVNARSENVQTLRVKRKKHSILLDSGDGLARQGVKKHVRRKKDHGPEEQGIGQQLA